MTLGPRDPGVRLCIGVPGAGKSHFIIGAVHASARSGMPILVVDPNHEWKAVPGDLAPYTRRIVDPARIADTFAHKDVRIVVLTPTNEVEAVESAVRWAAETSEVRGVAIHEAWLVAPASQIPGTEFRRVVRTWRHSRVALWLDAQRLSTLSRNVTDLATETRLFAVTGDRDFQVAREIGGRELESQLRVAAERLAAGQPGWHVVLGSHKLGPYKLVRSAP